MDLINTIKRMSHLARLGLPESELERYTQKARVVLDYVEQLNELDTSKVEPTSHAVELESISKNAKSIEPSALRADEVRNFEKPDEITKAAPEKDGAFVRVPRVIE